MELKVCAYSIRLNAKETASFVFGLVHSTGSYSELTGYGGTMSFDAFHGITILSAQTREEMMYALSKCVEKTQDFTDSAYTTHEHRENILLLCDRMRLELNQCLRMAVNMEQFPNARFDIDAAIDSVLGAAQDLSQQLSMAVADQIPELNHILKIGIELVNSLRNIALNQELDRLQECVDRFHDNIEHILEVSCPNLLDDYCVKSIKWLSFLIHSFCHICFCCCWF